MRKIPFIKIFYDMIMYHKDPITLIEKSMNKYGLTYMFNLIGFGNYIITSDPEFVEHVFVKKQKQYHKSKMQTKFIGKYLGKGLLTSNGEYWQRHRRMIQPAFHKKKLQDLNLIVNLTIDEYITELKSLEIIEIDLRHLCSKLALKVVTKSLFNIDMKKEVAESLFSDINFIQKRIVSDIRQPYLGWFFYLNGSKMIAKKKSNRLYKLITNIIKERRESNKSFNDLLDMFLSLKYEDGSGLSDQQILDEILVFLVAGHETVANTLSWAIYHIIKDNKIKEKLFKEFKDNEMNKKKVIDFEDLLKMNYTKQIIDESLRLYPSAWYFDRVAIKNDHFKDIYIPKGTIIGIFSYGTHRSSLFWEKSKEFIPERFNIENKGKIIPYSYYPFGKGMRFCIGKEFAIQEMKIAICKLFCNFHLEILGEKQKNRADGQVTLKPKYRMPTKLTIID